jgi:hypothetical protein
LLAFFLAAIHYPPVGRPLVAGLQPFPRREPPPPPLPQPRPTIEPHRCNSQASDAVLESFF